MGAMVVQGVIVVFGVPSLIVTLGGMIVFQGLLLVVLPPEFTVSVAGSDYARIASAHVSIGGRSLTTPFLAFVPMSAVGEN